MSTDRTDAKPRLWAFHRDGALVGVVADTAEAAVRALRDGSVPSVRLKSTPPLAPGEGESALVAIGSVDETTALLPGYRTHNQSVVTLEDETGSRWALRPSPRGVVPDEPSGDA